MEIKAKVFIPLSGKNGTGLVTVVDFNDYQRLSLFGKKISLNNGYARVGKKYLHRLVTNEEFDIVDHRDINRLNNSSSNLRKSSYAKNLANTMQKKGKKRGVYPARGKYRAAIVLNKKYVSLGTYDTELEAAAAYNGAAILVYGEHYRTQYGN